MATYNVGDSVTVWNSRQPVEVRTVARIAGRKVIDDKGGEWIAQSGWRWGAASQQWYTGSYIRATREGDAVRVLMLRRRAELVDVLKEALRDIERCDSAALINAYYEACQPLRAVLKRGEG